jgi:general secretion pathway protein E
MSKPKAKPNSTEQATPFVAFAHYLRDNDVVDVASLQRILAAQASTGQAIDTVILELGLLPEQKLADAMAGYLGFERIDPSQFPLDIPYADRLPAQFLKQHTLLPVGEENDQIIIATARPFDQDSIAALGYFLGLEPVTLVAVASEIKQHLAKLLSPVNDDTTETDLGVGISAQDDDVERLRDVAREAPVVRLLNRLVVQAVEYKASDIHFEPLQDQLRVRFRIDGALQVIESLPKQIQAGLISRVKILARLNIAEQRLPQDGRIRIPVHGRDIELRVSTAPASFGESVALRILDRQELPLDFTSLGFSSRSKAIVEDMIGQPNGIVLVTGPTGSGKTTTLYAALRILNSPDRKIFTVEDPVEYQLAGLNQINVRPQIGLDFASILRSLLRQDPDVIMVGEIRDIETARIAVQASLTGHLVLSTLHTNSAVAAVTRLVDMGLEDYLLASVLRGIVAQRLVRKLCLSCREPLRHIPEVAKRFEFGMDGRATFFKSRGCPTCHGTGFKGRTIIHEILPVTPDISIAISRRESELHLETKAREGGMVSLLEQGLSRAALGETSSDEILRTVGSGS